MSKHHMEKLTCPSCHHDGDFEVWDSINTVLDPEMKEKVLNQSIFLYTCPNCGETFRLNYPILYHQMEDLVMIYLVPESEVEKTYEIFYEKNALADFRTEKYLNRIVTSAICMNLLFHTAMISKISAMMRILLSIGNGSLTNLPKQKTNSIFGGYTPKPL